MGDRGSSESPPSAPLPPAVRVHLEELTDRFGILQHATGHTGDPRHGYCADDVARALELDLMQGRYLGWAAVADRARSNVQFLSDSYVAAERWFRNFRSVDGEWLPGQGSQDCQGRVTLALGSLVAECPEPGLTNIARDLLLDVVCSIDRLRSPRAMASSVLGLDAALNDALDGGAPAVAHAHSRLALRLMAAFGAADPAWYWPEETLTYENALLPRALIVAGSRLDLPAMTAVGLRALDWLIENQTSPDGHLSPVGNGWWSRGGRRSQFDQQPIEATALLRACRSALAVTGLRRYRAAMEHAYAWFLGANDLGLAIVDPVRGAGCDGLTEHGVNLNEGAESTLMWLIAVEQMRPVEAGMVQRVAPPAVPAGSAAFLS